MAIAQRSKQGRAPGGQFFAGPEAAGKGRGQGRAALRGPKASEAERGKGDDGPGGAPKPRAKEETRGSAPSSFRVSEWYLEADGNCAGSLTVAVNESNRVSILDHRSEAT